MRVFIITLITLIMLSCATTKDRVVVETKVVVPSFACPIPDDYNDKMKSVIDAKNESELISIISYNVLILQQTNAEWVEFYVCIESILEKYNKKVDKVE